MYVCMCVCVCVGGGGVNDAVQVQEMLTFPGQERGHSQTVTEKCVCVWGGGGGVQ